LVTNSGLRGLLAQPAYRRLWLARTVSQVGDVAQFTTLALLLVTLTGSGLGVTGAVLAEIAPVLLLALAGSLVDRLPRVKVMVVHQTYPHTHTDSLWSRRGAMTDTAAEPHEHPVDPERVAHARARGLSAEDAADWRGLLSLLADPVRSRILYALDEVEELCVGDLALALSAPVRSGVLSTVVDGYRGAQVMSAISEAETYLHCEERRVDGRNG